jgi:hypothetical protein
MRKIAALIFALLALGLVAAGCGGGGDSTGSSSTADTTSSSSEGSESGSGDESAEAEAEGESDEGESGSGAAPTKAAFIKEADQICTAGDTKLSEEVVSFAEGKGIDLEKEEEPSEDQQVEIYEQIILPNIAKQAEDLEALTPPAGEEDQVEDITSTLTKEVEEAEEDPSDIGNGTLEGASKKAQAYGLKACGA